MVVGDLLNSEDAARAVADVDTVVSAVGTHPAHVYRADEFVDGRGNVNLVEAVVDAGVDTFVMESSLGVGDDRSSLLARAFRLSIAPVVAAKSRAERAIHELGQRYTILGPGVLVGRLATDDVQVADSRSGMWGVVSRTNVARLMVAALRTPEARNRTFDAVRNPLFSGRGVGIEWADVSTR